MAAPPWRTGTSTNGNNRNAAFTTVNARKNLASPRSGFPQANTTQTAETASPPAGQSGTIFPEKLKAYVARTFEDCPQEQKSEVEAELKKIITDAFNEKVVWTLAWDDMPLPQVLLARKKAGDKKEKKGKEKTKPALQQNVFVSSRSDLKRALSPSPPQPRYNAAMGVDNGGKKRKSSTGDDILSSRKYDDRFDKRARHDPSPMEKLSLHDNEKRARRFADDRDNSTPPYRSVYSQTPRTPDNNEPRPVIGRSQVLEKKYFRLTSEPNPDNVRPLEVLEKTLDLLKKKWRTEQNYAYICDQFKSVRQDLTVQHIKSDFTVQVYEIHARIAMEKGDLGEYNQCQTQLYSLYGEGFKGHEEEFKAYRILYLLHTCNRADMNDLLANLTPTDKQDKGIRHALQVRSVLAAGNFHRFFRLYLDSPNMGGYLMDSFIGRERMAALCTICKAYRPDIDIRFLTEELGFESDTECVTFLCDNGAEDLIEQKSDDKGVPSSIRFQTSRAITLFEGAKRAAFKKVDIKGQL